jgi:hypothetical protein
MKYLKNVLVIMIVCAITLLDAKVMKQKLTTTTIQPKPYSLVPTHENALKNFGLCPLFEKKVLTKEDVKDLQRQGYTQEEISNFTIVAFPHYSVFNEKTKLLSGETSFEFENKNVAINAPCSVQLGRYGNWNRTLMQLKTLDQFELADKTGFSPAMCGGLSLNNGRLIRNYAYTGNQENLKKLHDIGDATNFLRDLKIGDWLNAQVLRNNFKTLGVELGIDGVNVSAVSTVALFDSNLHKTATFAVVFDEDEFVYVQRVKKNIQEGLKKDNYFHIMIIGNEETISGKGLGHYFCFAIIKVGNQIQYIILDTLPSAYHLQEGSHERDRLMFVIQNIEQGHSSIKITNIQVNNYLELLEKERIAGEEAKKKSLR